MSSSLVQVYLFFGGCCEEAIEFYGKAVGAQVEMIMRHKDSPEPPPPGTVPAGWENKIMHASFRIGQTAVMASDGCGESAKGFQGFSLSLNVATPEEADKVFATLSEGGKVNLPLSKTFWSAKFGMLEDRFGIGWMVGVMPEDQPA